MPEITKEKRILEELNQIKIPFEEIDGNKKTIIAPLLQNTAFMKVTLEDLQEIINKEGAVEAYQNGANQHGMKQSAAVQSYNAIVKNYASVVKTLYSLMPPEKKATAQGSIVWRAKKEETEEEREEYMRQVREDNERMIEEWRKAGVFEWGKN